MDDEERCSEGVPVMTMNVMSTLRYYNQMNNKPLLSTSMSTRQLNSWLFDKSVVL